MRIRIEIEDKGCKCSYELELQKMNGEAVKNKVIDFLSATSVFDSSGDGIASTAYTGDYSSKTIMDRLESLIRYEFSNVWFTTQELRERYEALVDDIKLSTASTYLYRMNRDGLLDRRGNRNNRQYRLIEIIEPENLRQESKSLNNPTTSVKPTTQLESIRS